MEDETRQDTEQSAGKGRGRHRGLRIGILLLVAVLAAHFGPRALYSLSHESTDDAFVDGRIVPVSAEVSGKVSRVLIEDNQPVKAGEVLLEIEDDHYRLTAGEKKAQWERRVAEADEIRLSIEEKVKALEKAKANMEAAAAEEELARKNRDRYRRLLQMHSVSQSLYEKFEAEWKVAEARARAARAAIAETDLVIQNLKAKLPVQKKKIREAEASLGLATLTLHKTEIRAPLSGRVAKKNIEPGKYVHPGQALLSIVDGKNVWVVANFKETQIENMRVGNPVDIRVDAYPGRTFKGHVDSFQPGTGSVFSLLPPENSTGNFVKVVQRVPVKIVIDSPGDPARVLCPGMSVVAYVKTGGTAESASGAGSAALER